MKKASKRNTEAQLLGLLKSVLPKATDDPHLAGRIYQAIEAELRAQAQAVAFEKFCAQVPLPNLEPASVAEVQRQLAEGFGEGDVTIKPNRKQQTLAVEVALPDGRQFQGQITVNPNAVAKDAEEDEVKQPFVPLPVCLPGDPELVWALARRENLGPDEAGIALARLEEEFWASKTGQKLLRDRVEKSFPEFISRVPAGMLGEAGLKRHYKTPEPVKALRRMVRK